MKNLIIVLAMFLTIQGIGQDYIQNQGKVPDLSFIISGNLTGSVSLDTLYDANGLSTYYGKTVMYLPNDVVTGVYSSSIYDKSYLELRREYKAYCDSIVIDTLVEDGKINYDVKLVDGKAELTPIDTIWYVRVCEGYKNISKFVWTDNELGWTTTTGTVLTTTGNNLNYVTLTDYSEIETKFYVKITREKYCKCKNQPATYSDFFEWVDKNYLK